MTVTSAKGGLPIWSAVRHRLSARAGTPSYSWLVKRDSRRESEQPPGVAEVAIDPFEKPETFGAHLRRLRVAAALTQERLAERAGISSAGVAALESGRRRSPRLTTISLLADALGLDAAQRASLASAATGDGSGSPAVPDRTAAPNPAAAAAALDRAAPGVEPPPIRKELAPVGGWRTPFVGRATQLSALASAWSERRRLVLIVGQAGVGKTRLAAEFAMTIKEQGATVVSGRWTSDWLGPYAGFVGLLRQALAQVDPSDITGGNELVRLLPELSSRFAPDQGPSRADTGVERRLLFDAVSQVFERLGPVLVLLDDLQWADPDSLALLGYLGGQPLADLMLLATVRSGDLPPTTAGALAHLGRVCEVDRIALDGLPSEELGLLVRQIAGEAASPELAAAVTTASEGNPFYAEELTEHFLNPTGRLSAAGSIGRSRLPERIKDTVGRRVATLSPPAQSLLRAGAVLGRDFDPRLAAHLAELSDTEAIAAIEDALLSGLVLEAAPPMVSFSHGLVQATVESSLSVLRRVALHRRAATALADSNPSQPDVIAQLARHWMAVAEIDGSAAPSAAYWTVRAGDAALGSAAAEEAIARYESAARLWARSTTEHADTLIRLGNALYSCGRGPEADGRFREAFHLAQGLNDDKLVALAALGLAKGFVTGEIGAERVAALEAALGRLPTDDTVLRPAVAAMLVRELLFDRSPEATARRDELWDEVGRAVTSETVSPELLLTLASAQDLIPASDPEPLDRVSRLTIAVAHDRRDLFALANAWWTQAWSALERANPEDWSTAVSSYEEVAKALQLPAQTGLAASLRSTAAQIEGRLDEARELAAAAAADLTRAGNPSAQMLYLSRSVLMGWDDGQAGELLPLVTSLAKDFANIVTFQAGLALTAALAGDHELARYLLGKAAGSGFDRIRIDVEWLAVTSFYAHVCALTDAVEHAEPLYELLVTSPATAVRCGQLMGWWGPVDHHLGSLCRLLGRRAEAYERLQHARAVEQAMQGRHFLLRTTDELRALDRGE
jgi:transcriptional regulator with XRE-family HTH domain/tetratricopeptide (TPR) repeat protein